MILLDTHVIIWLAFDQARISRKAKAAIEETRARAEAVAICDISLLEIATLERKRRIMLNTTLETFLTDVEARFAVVPITATVCVRARGLPESYPSDPADRIIGATSLVKGFSLITADNAIRRAKALPTIW